MKKECQVKKFFVEDFSKVIKEYKFVNLILSVLLLLGGIAMIAFAFLSSLIFVAIAISMLLISGGGFLFYFLNNKKSLPSFHLLLNSVINLLLGLMLLVALCVDVYSYAPLDNETLSSLLFVTTSLYYWVFFAYALASLFRGAFRVLNAKENKICKKYGFIVGIIQIVLSFLLIVFIFLPIEIASLIAMILLGVFTIYRAVVIFIDTAIFYKEKGEILTEKEENNEDLNSIKNEENN